ncbi:MAG TPA: helix-turn-helix transcriptional regulator [Anaerolineaceae bacterium]|nr:helix-turn-helix transcriptional regulator [Anaerolineaceae bacterium]
MQHLVAPEHRQMTDKVKSYIANHLKEPLNLEDLAAISGLSTSYFARQYKATTGRTPMEDLRLLRLEEARRLLVKTPLPLYEIATQVGIPDVYYLSRLLKEQFGISARKLRSTGHEYDKTEGSSE